MLLHLYTWPPSRPKGAWVFFRGSLVPRIYSSLHLSFAGQSGWSEIPPSTTLVTLEFITSPLIKEKHLINTHPCHKWRGFQVVNFYNVIDSNSFQDHTCISSKNLSLIIYLVIYISYLSKLPRWKLNIKSESYHSEQVSICKVSRDPSKGLSQLLSFLLSQCASLHVLECL